MRQVGLAALGFSGHGGLFVGEVLALGRRGLFGCLDLALLRLLSRNALPLGGGLAVNLGLLF
ncbi:hypothetical protein D3C71_2000910 [compost metagenome]